MMIVVLHFSLLLLNIIAPLEAQQIFNIVTDYGAVGDGYTEDTKAFNDAWNATCETASNFTTMFIPSGKTFLVQPLLFKGSCKSNNILVQLDGNISAPLNPHDWHCHSNQQCSQLLFFFKVDNLSIEGTGTIDGHGYNWWDCRNDKYGCPRKPTGLVISHCNNVQLRDISTLNTPQVHIDLSRSSEVFVSGLTISAPGYSPNTDGIHIQGSHNVTIQNSTIGTGDDCISIGDGSTNIDISMITCGPGHGISVGSLGEGGSEVKVEDIYVRDVIFKGTTNGARIKTWQGGNGYARNIVFERVRCYDSVNPIIIDQYYCARSQNCGTNTSAVQVSNVTFSEFYGTSRKPTAVNLACSTAVACNNIFMNNINMIRTGGRPASSYCLSVNGNYYGVMEPMVPCLQPL